MSFQDLEAGVRVPPQNPFNAAKRKQQQQSQSQSQDPSQAVAAAIFQINTAVSSFYRLVNSLGTPKDTLDLRDKLHKTRLHIGQLVKDTSSKLKQASEADHHTEVSPIRKIADAKLAKDFQSVLKEFQKAQRLAAERETTYAPFVPKESLSSSSEDVFGEFFTLNQYELDIVSVINSKLIELHLISQKQNGGFVIIINVGTFCSCFYSPQEPEISSSRTSQQQLLLQESKRQEVVLLDNEITFNEAIIEEREQGIKEIQEQISEVNEIFKDLAVLVHEQGVMIDDISSNIESSHASTAQATTQLAKASKIQKSSSSLSCLLLVIFGIILLIVIILIVA
ncbi:hypothetical protein CUMW_215830 [Citrus unshiu]|uniref:t-SNARE coiled-coil homology domain-containing protein n=1 Tax=Citrus unshiu TaxID=55188 RepID=A0A2H5QCA2_CITUN|nr:hypothetical protein CUMW_215830 [Citrus unshiu]